MASGSSAAAASSRPVAATPGSKGNERPSASQHTPSFASSGRGDDSERLSEAFLLSMRLEREREREAAERADRVAERAATAERERTAEREYMAQRERAAERERTAERELRMLAMAAVMMCASAVVCAAVICRK